MLGGWLVTMVVGPAMLATAAVVLAYLRWHYIEGWVARLIAARLT